MIYADFNYYQNSYFGTEITEERTFNGLALKASAFLDAITYNRIDKTQPIDDAVKNAACAVTEVRKTYDDGKGGIASESVGKASVSYANADGKTLEQESYNAAYPFLIGTGLLYQGV
ncbi:hypothetical protein [Eubacterium maltosivorans]|uniref:Uncharacterized protein n=1 Tax=Eubacterium maltosivorans TaxID=2041044 RepID=A0A4P9C632_EUBML|nr:hypothetical protein [Eubacterium maltosivorans]QCT70833.1 hypothetical protein CPZ25_005650 [Eubacterium maltosivorans]